MAKTKRTWQPKKLKRIRKHGFMKRLETPGGKNVLKARARKGRKRLAIKISSKH